MNKRIAVVGGGIGVPPLLELATRHRESCNAILGFRSREQLVECGARLVADDPAHLLQLLLEQL